MVSLILGQAAAACLLVGCRWVLANHIQQAIVSWSRNEPRGGPADSEGHCPQRAQRQCSHQADKSDPELGTTRAPEYAQLIELTHRDEDAVPIPYSSTLFEWQRAGSSVVGLGIVDDLWSKQLLPGLRSFRDPNDGDRSMTHPPPVLLQEPCFEAGIELLAGGDLTEVEVGAGSD